MMAAGMRPGALGPLGAAAAAAAASGAAAAGKGAAEGSKVEPKKEPAPADRGAERREGPPGGAGRYGGRRDEPEYDAWAERERYERERERYEGRGGPRGPPPFGRDGPPPPFFRDGPRGPPDFRWGSRVGCVVIGAGVWLLTSGWTALCCLGQSA